MRLTTNQLLIVFGWEAAELSEGEAAKLLNLDRVTARELRAAFVEQVHKIRDGGVSDIEPLIVRYRSDD